MQPAGSGDNGISPVTSRNTVPAVPHTPFHPGNLPAGRRIQPQPAETGPVPNGNGGKRLPAFDANCPVRKKPDTGNSGNTSTGTKAESHISGYRTPHIFRFPHRSYLLPSPYPPPPASGFFGNPRNSRLSPVRCSHCQPVENTRKINT